MASGINSFIRPSANPCTSMSNSVEACFLICVLSPLVVSALMQIRGSGRYMFALLSLKFGRVGICIMLILRRPQQFWTSAVEPLEYRARRHLPWLRASPTMHNISTCPGPNSFAAPYNSMRFGLALPASCEVTKEPSEKGLNTINTKNVGININLIGITLTSKGPQGCLPQSMQCAAHGAAKH